jgi:hypothetical protein
MRRSGKTKIKMMRIGTSAICRHPGTTHITDDRKRKPPLRAEVKCRQLPSNHTRGGSASRPLTGNRACALTRTQTAAKIMRVVAGASIEHAGHKATRWL